MAKDNRPDHFRSILEPSQLPIIFNDCLERPPAHAALYWQKLQTVINGVKTGIEIKKGEGVFLIKYLLVDTFGCAVPVFIDFSYELETVEDSINKFKSITILINDYKNKYEEEVQSGW